MNEKLNERCKYFEYMFLECMKLPPINNKCKNEFQLWFKCIKYV